MVAGLDAAKAWLAKNRQFALWALVVGLFVMVIPAFTFFSNRAREVSATRPEEPLGAVFDAGLPYGAERLFSLPVAEDAALADAVREDGASPVTVEVIAPSGDGGLWIVDHPPGVRPRARARLVTYSGTVRSEFEFREIATLFTPGPGSTLWAVSVDGDTGAETLVQHDRSGKRVARFKVPAGVHARAIVFGPRGVYVLQEQWSVNPQSGDLYYAGALWPVALGKTYRVPTATEDAAIAGGLFFDAAGDLYALDTATSTANAYGSAVKVVAPDGTTKGSVPLPADFRPFAADGRGGILAEGPWAPDTDAVLHSTVGDAADERVALKVLDSTGTRATLQLPGIARTFGWTPVAWPAEEGSLIAWQGGVGRIDVLRVAPDAKAKAASAEAAVSAADMRIIVPSEPLSGDPYLARDVAERDLFQVVYSGLVSFDASLTPRPAMAQEIPSIRNGGVSKDGLTIRYRLREGQEWHDGEPVTAEDVVATWRHLRDRPLAGPEPFPGFAVISDVRADGLDVAVTLSEPFGAGPEAFFPYVLPAHIVDSGAHLLNGGLTAAPVGSGPFKVVRWEAGSRWVLERALRTAEAPNVLEVRFAGTDKAPSLFAAVPAAVWSWVPATDADELMRKGLGTATQVATGRWVGEVFDASTPSLRDPAVRKALVSLYPAGRLRRSIFPVAAGSVDPFVPGQPAHRTDLGTGGAGEGRAPVTALDGLAIEYAGASRNGLPEVVPEHIMTAESEWASAGVSVRRSFATARFYASWWRAGWLSAQAHSVSVGVFPGSIDAGWGGVFDPAERPSVRSPWGRGVGGGTDPVLARLHDQARRSYDRAERARLSGLVTERILEQDLAIFDYYEQRGLASRGAVEGLSPGPYPAGDFWNVGEWRVGDAQ